MKKNLIGLLYLLMLLFSCNDSKKESGVIVESTGFKEITGKAQIPAFRMLTHNERALFWI
ncbi:hypothetical protein [Chryseobacterium sp. OV279]|uniref:hypothetical protein n=1 Tax=Chryseobacterium sp. OV279 TaxID=1500285 RepID=UPI0009322EAA|nr:hypothetical protein [Chryseobacterium sp. OV279]